MATPLPDLEAILKRLDNLEKQNRRMKYAAWASLGLAGTLTCFCLGTVALSAVLAFTQGREVHARRFSLEDENLTERGSVELDQGASRLYMSDQTGTRFVSIRNDRDEQYLGFFCDELAWARLTVSKDGSSLGLSDPSGKWGGKMMVAEEEQYLSFYGKEVERGQLRVTKSESALTLTDDSGKRHAELGVDKTSQHLGFYDGSDKVRILFSGIGRTDLECN